MTGRPRKMAPRTRRSRDAHDSTQPLSLDPITNSSTPRPDPLSVWWAYDTLASSTRMAAECLSRRVGRLLSFSSIRAWFSRIFA
jgi:hypothetical protein